MLFSRSVLPALLAAAFLSAGFAQDPRGTILGRVLDSSGAAVPGAEVRAVNDDTGVAASAKANDAGNFTMPYLLSGTYTVSCEHPGFKKWVRPGIQVRINDNVEVNIDLQIGATSETIEVTETTPLLSTAEASLGQVVDQRRVLELPQFAGNAMDLVHLAPGTINGTNLRLRKAGFNSAPSTFSTDGTGNNQAEFSIDGVSNTYSDGTAPRVAFSPPQFAISEFKIQTSTFDAALGHTMGSTVNVSIKSGTNQLHGEMHEWFRHSALDAPTIFQNRSGQAISIYQDNRYGVSAGAPVYIPKVYNGKNKTFWFVSYEANKFGNPDSGGNITSSVPTAKMHSRRFLRVPGPRRHLSDLRSAQHHPDGRQVCAHADSRQCDPHFATRPGRAKPDQPLPPAESGRHQGFPGQLLPFRQGARRLLGGDRTPGPRFQREPPHLPSPAPRLLAGRQEPLLSATTSMA